MMKVNCLLSYLLGSGLLLICVMSSTVTYTYNDENPYKLLRLQKHLISPIQDLSISRIPVEKLKSNADKFRYLENNHRSQLTLSDSADDNTLHLYQRISKTRNSRMLRSVEAPSNKASDNGVQTSQDITVQSSTSAAPSNLTLVQHTGDDKHTETSIPSTSEPQEEANQTSNTEVHNDAGGVLPNRALSADALRRGFLVFLGCSGIVVIYLSTKFVCNRRRKRYSKVARGDDLDMFPLTVSQDGDDEDEELFSASAAR